jgi:hypothetical protein
MSFWDRVFGDDHQRAADRYEGRESASDSAARSRRQSHKRSGATRAARQGQAWEDADRANDRKGGWYRAR